MGAYKSANHIFWQFHFTAKLIVMLKFDAQTNNNNMEYNNNTMLNSGDSSLHNRVRCTMNINSQIQSVWHLVHMFINTVHDFWHAVVVKKQNYMHRANSYDTHQVVGVI